MTSFRLSPLSDADFDRMLTYTEEPGGTLIAPLLHMTWPAADTESNNRRNAWSIEQQRWQFHNDRTVRFMKVEDTTTNDIISLARWHRYENGYPQGHLASEIDVNAFVNPSQSPKFPDGMNGTLHAGMLETVVRRRAAYIRPGVTWSANFLDFFNAETDWCTTVLTTLITREKWRRQGAAGMLLDWGLDQAARESAPSYLEAVPTAKSLYEKHGFRQVDETAVDCQAWGLDAEMKLAIMRVDPN